MTPPDEAQIPARVLDMLHERFRVPRERLSVEADLIQDLGLDSLDRIELVFELEQLFGVQITDEDARGVRTVSDIVERSRRWLRPQSAE